MSCKITWVFALDACTGMYGIQIIFGHDKDYSDACRNKGLYLKNTRSDGAVTVPYVIRYGAVQYGTVPYFNIIHVKVP